MNADPNEARPRTLGSGDGDSFDVDAWLDAHAYEPAREELEPDYSTERGAP